MSDKRSSKGAQGQGPEYDYEADKNLAYGTGATLLDRLLKKGSKKDTQSTDKSGEASSSQDTTLPVAQSTTNPSSPTADEPSSNFRTPLLFTSESKFIFTAKN